MRSRPTPYIGATLVAGGDEAEAELRNALERLERLGRPLNSVVAAIDNPARASTGPLLGIPIAVKDMINVAGHALGNGNPEDMAGPAAEQTLRSSPPFGKQERTYSLWLQCSSTRRERNIPSCRKHETRLTRAEPLAVPAADRRHLSERACARRRWEPTRGALYGFPPTTAESSV